MAQPNMGSRTQVVTRPPRNVAEAFEREIAGTNLSYSQFLADLVADRYGRPRPSERFATKSAQTALPLDRVTARQVQEPQPRYLTRLPQDLAGPFEDEAVAEGLSYSQFLTDLLAARYNISLPGGRDQRLHASQAQEVLPLDRAS